VFENKELSTRLYRRDVIERGFKTLHNEKLHNLYFSPSTIRMIKSRMKKLAEHVAQMGERGMHIGYLLESRKEEDCKDHVAGC
jgi:hypothetical protein